MPQADVNVKVNHILRGLSEWWSIAGNRRQALARVSYIIRYSVAKMYAAKFKLPTVASVFKMGGNNLGKPLGASKKSAIGSNANQDKIQGILFDRYHKIPRPKGSKLKPDWCPEFLEHLREDVTPERFVMSLWNISRSSSKNPLAQMMWRLENTISRQGAPCAVCGSYDDVQMHHERPLKDINSSKSKIHKHMMAISREQIPLCRTHHLAAHKGN